MLISITGLRGSGKSTQISKLVKYYNDRGMDTESFALYRIPVSKVKILSETKAYLNGELGQINSKDEYKMIMQAVGLKIAFTDYVEPALKKDKIVILDRYTETFDVDFEEYELPHKLLSELPKPDLTIMLEINIEEARERLLERDNEISEKTIARQEKRFFYQKKLVNNKDVIAVDANQPIEAVFHDIIQTIGEYSQNRIS